MLFLFDLDDTLLNHREADRAAAEDLHEKFAASKPRVEFLDLWKQAQDRHYKRYYAGEISFQEQRRARIRDVLAQQMQDVEADRIFDDYLKAYEENWRLFDDVMPCLERLSSFRLGIITNGDGAQQRKKMEKVGIAERFDCIVISGECGLSKPNKEIFLSACNLMKEDPTNAVYVGDRYDLDAVASRAAGLFGIWLDRNSAQTDEHALPIITSLAELTDRI